MKIDMIGKTIHGVDIASTAGRLSRAKGTVSNIFQLSQSKSDKENLNFINRVTSMGHFSIIDHVYFNFLFEDVTPIVEQLLIKSRLCSVTIKSRREVNFCDGKYYVPEFDNEDNKEKFINNMDNLFNSYQQLIDLGIKLEDARYILPYTFNSQIIFGASATELIRLINLFTKGEYSKIPEVKTFGNKIYELMEKELPIIKTLIDKSNYKDNSPIKDFLNQNIVVDESNLIDKTTLLDIPINKTIIDDTICLSAIMRIYNLSLEDAENVYYKALEKDNTFKEKLMYSISKDNCKDDLRSVSFRFAFPISFANLTHLTRHRGIDLFIPDFDSNIDITKIVMPSMISENKEAFKIANEAVIQNKKTFDELKAVNVSNEILMYQILSGNKLNVVAGFDGEVLRYFTKMRVCKKAQWEIRNIALDMINELEIFAQNYTSIIGASCMVDGICPEGKEMCKSPYEKKRLMNKLH